MGEGIGFVVIANLKTHLVVVIGRSRHICDREDRIESCQLPPPAMSTDLLVPPHIEPVKALIADLDFPVGMELHGLFNCLSAA